MYIVATVEDNMETSADYDALEAERKGRKEFLIALLMGHDWGRYTLEELEEIITLISIQA